MLMSKVSRNVYHQLLSYRRRAAIVLGVSATLILASTAASAGTSGNKASAPGITKSTVTVGLISSFSGPLASGFTTVATGFNARIALQNAEGGVNGRKIEVVKGDDQGSPTQALAAAKLLVEQKHVFAIGAVSDVLFGATTYLTKQGVPVTGAPFDGPEWAPPNNNMFPNYGSPSPKYPAGKYFGNFFKAQGATNVAVVTYDVPTAVAVAKNVRASVEAVGLKATYINYTVPLTQEGNFGSIVAAMKQQGVNGVYFPLNPTQYFAILTEMAQAGLHMKATILGVPPTAGTALNAQTKADLKNTWVGTPWQPVQLETTATKAFQAALLKYEHQKTQPDRNEYEGWAAAAAIIQGLQVAGKNPTQASFISSLRKVNDFTADGLAVSPVSFTKSYGTGVEGPAGPAPKNCAYFLKYNGSQFVPLQSAPTCGGIVPNSDAN
jgi:branched-chain amino acid transport system substrate-binding protein